MLKNKLIIVGIKEKKRILQTLGKKLSMFTIIMLENGKIKILKFISIRNQTSQNYSMFNRESHREFNLSWTSWKIKNLIGPDETNKRNLWKEETRS